MLVNTSPGETPAKLSPKQDTFIALLLAGITIAAAATQIGIAESTAHKWLKLPHVLDAYKLAQKSLFDDRLAELRDGVGTALSTIKRTMTSEDALPATQLRAAQIWLEQSIALYKMSELEQEVRTLQQLIKDRQV